MDYNRLISQMDQIQFDFWSATLNTGIRKSTKKEEIVWRIIIDIRKKLDKIK